MDSVFYLNSEQVNELGCKGKVQGKNELAMNVSRSRGIDEKVSEEERTL